MADLGPLGGVKITGFISPTDTNDTYAVIDPIYGIDGLRNEITGCFAALQLYMMHDDSGLDTLEYFGYDIKEGDEKVRSRLLKKKTKLEMLESSQKTNDKRENINFWRMVSKVEKSLNRQLKIDEITVIRWIELIKEINER